MKPVGCLSRRTSSSHPRKPSTVASTWRHGTPAISVPMRMRHALHVPSSTRNSIPTAPVDFTNQPKGHQPLQMPGKRTNPTASQAACATSQCNSTEGQDGLHGGPVMGLTMTGWLLQCNMAHAARLAVEMDEAMATLPVDLMPQVPRWLNRQDLVDIVLSNPPVAATVAVLALVLIPRAVKGGVKVVALPLSTALLLYLAVAHPDTTRETFTSTLAWTQNHPALTSAGILLVAGVVLLPSALLGAGAVVALVTLVKTASMDLPPMPQPLVDARAFVTRPFQRPGADDAVLVSDGNSRFSLPSIHLPKIHLPHQVEDRITQLKASLPQVPKLPPQVSQGLTQIKTTVDNNIAPQVSQGLNQLKSTVANDVAPQVSKGLSQLKTTVENDVAPQVSKGLSEGFNKLKTTVEEDVAPQVSRGLSKGFSKLKASVDENVAPQVSERFNDFKASIADKVPVMPKLPTWSISLPSAPSLPSFPSPPAAKPPTTQLPPAPPTPPKPAPMPPPPPTPPLILTEEKAVSPTLPSAEALGDGSSAPSAAAAATPLQSTINQQPTNSSSASGGSLGTQTANVQATTAAKAQSGSPNDSVPGNTVPTIPQEEDDVDRLLRALDRSAARLEEPLSLDEATPVPTPTSNPKASANERVLEILERS